LTYAEIAKACGGTKAGVCKGLDRLRQQGLVIFRKVRHKYDIEKIITAVKAGKSTTQIAQELSVKPGCITNQIQRYRKKGLLPPYNRRRHDLDALNSVWKA
jgi:biotin operon repressor